MRACRRDFKKNARGGLPSRRGRRLSSVDCFKQECYKQQQIRSRFEMN
nr:MAG TPA: hypothetical protein [Caudoviricetes sp.]